MKILFSGDSFTYGDELSNREKDRFSRLVSEHYSAEEINRAECGSSNDKIVRDVFEYLHLFNVDAGKLEAQARPEHALAVFPDV